MASSSFDVQLLGDINDCIRVTLGVIRHGHALDLCVLFPLFRQ